MPQRTLVKEENQPSITTLLPNCPLSTVMESEVQVLDLTREIDIDDHEGDKEEFKKVNNRKRKHHSSGSPQLKPTKKFLQETQIKWQHWSPKDMPKMEDLNEIVLSHDKQHF